MAQTTLAMARLPEKDQSEDVLREAVESALARLGGDLQRIAVRIEPRGDTMYRFIKQNHG